MKIPGRDRFRERHPDFLAPAGDPPVFTPPAWWSERRYVEMRVAHDLMVGEPYVTDLVQYGVSDEWVASFTGDCEDKALAAHERLAGQGWPKSSMRIMVRPAKGWSWLPSYLPAHAVLALHVTIWGTPRVIALDCMQRSPVPLAEIPGAWEAV